MSRILFGGREVPIPYRASQTAPGIDLGNAPDIVGVTIDECENEDVIEENPTTRIVLQSTTFPPNNGIDDFNITGYLCHARRSRTKSGEEWQPVKNFNLRNMKVGDYVRIQLGPHNLKALFLALADKYSALGGLESILAEAGIKTIDPEVATVLEGRERDTLQALMERDDDFWDNVADLDTRNALETKAPQLEHQRRKDALSVFKEHMDAKDWSEGEWEAFLKTNEWIFGLGLSYQYMSTIQNQAHLGGTAITGRGTDRVDYLMATSGDSRFTVLVDIKKPNARFLHSAEYRSNIFHISREVAGGVAQLQSYCHTWTIEGSQHGGNTPEKLGAYTYEPKGMLIVGHLAELGDDDAKRKSFELFRRHTNNPQILTFDEVFSRVEYMVTHPDVQVIGESTKEMGDVPF